VVLVLLYGKLVIPLGAEDARLTAGNGALKNGVWKSLTESTRSPDI
jgi:hypothetical protein